MIFGTQSINPNQMVVHVLFVLNDCKWLNTAFGKKSSQINVILIIL